MYKITLISPYFGNSFPENFPLLLDSLKYNPKVKFVIPTNIDNQSDASNVIFVRMEFEELVSKIDNMIGYKSAIKNPYKLVDFKPTYGQLFQSYIGDSEWWGYFDSDVIFGDINKFITTDMLEKYDRIFNLGHLTLFKNNTCINSLWKHDFNFPEVPNFKEVACSPTCYAFDEWGWGKNRGRGLSYALKKANLVSQFDDINYFADIKPENFGFHTTSNLKLKYFKYYKGKLTGFDYSDSEFEFLYAHFQKRTLINDIDTLEKPVYIYPNILRNNSQNYSVTDEEERWNFDRKKRRFNHIKSNLLSLSYIKRRIRFLHTEK